MGVWGQVQTGKQVELCSEFCEEEEVLLPLNSHFRVQERAESPARHRQLLAFLADYDTSALVLYALAQL